MSAYAWHPTLSRATGASLLHLQSTCVLDLAAYVRVGPSCSMVSIVSNLGDCEYLLYVYLLPVKLH